MKEEERERKEGESGRKREVKKESYSNTFYAIE